jgi:protein SCO1/2
MNSARSARRPLARTVAILLVALAATLAGAFAARSWLARRAEPPATRVAAVFREPRPLPAFALVAHDGTRFDNARLKGHWSLLFFGFTNCPDVCPTTLTQLAATRRQLADLPPAQSPAVLMISVDPKRDTPQRLAEYVPYFDRSFTGATGTRAMLDVLTRSMGVAVHIGPVVVGSYTVDHTAALFLVDPDARLVAVFPAPHDAATLAADYRTIVAGAGARAAAH